MLNSAILVGIGYITARGCAPFNKDFFPAAMQKGMAGDYWKVRRLKKFTAIFHLNIFYRVKVTCSVCVM